MKKYSPTSLIGARLKQASNRPEGVLSQTGKPGMELLTTDRLLQEQEREHRLRMKLAL